MVLLCHSGRERNEASFIIGKFCSNYSFAAGNSEGDPQSYLLLTMGKEATVAVHVN